MVFWNVLRIWVPATGEKFIFYIYEVKFALYFNFLDFLEILTLTLNSSWNHCLNKNYDLFLISRFVGYLEEQAVVTYTHILQELDSGNLPMWSKLPAPEIAVKYWELGPNAMMRDVILGTIHKPHGQIFGVLTPPTLPVSTVNTFTKYCEIVPWLRNMILIFTRFLWHFVKLTNSCSTVSP